MEAEAGREIRSNLRHDNHTVSLLTDHLVFSLKYGGSVARRRCRSDGRNYQGNLQRVRYRGYRYGCESVRHGWNVVEKYISEQKGYEKTDTVPVVVIEEEKGKLRAHKTGYITPYNKLFGGQHQK